MTDLADRAVAIVGVNVEQQRHAAGTVPFQGKFFVSCTRQFSSAALDGPLDVVGRHVLGFGCGDGAAQARIRIGIPTAILGGNADFLDQAGENLAALSVERALLMLNCGPF